MPEQPFLLSVEIYQIFPLKQLFKQIGLSFSVIVIAHSSTDVVFAMCTSLLCNYFLFDLNTFNVKYNIIFKSVTNKTIMILFYANFMEYIGPFLLFRCLLIHILLDKT